MNISDEQARIVMGAVSRGIDADTFQEFIEIAKQGLFDYEKSKRHSFDLNDKSTWPQKDGEYVTNLCVLNFEKSFEGGWWLLSGFGEKCPIEDCFNSPVTCWQEVPSLTDCEVSNEH